MFPPWCREKDGAVTTRCWFAPAGDRQARLWHPHHHFGSRAEGRDAVGIRQNTGETLANATNAAAALPDPGAAVHLCRAAGWAWRPWWPCWRPPLTPPPAWSASPETRLSGCRSWSASKWYVSLKLTFWASLEVPCAQRTSVTDQRRDRCHGRRQIRRCRQAQRKVSWFSDQVLSI